MSATDEVSYIRSIAHRVRRQPGYCAFRRRFRATKRFLPSLWRRSTQSYRDLPGVVIVGAQKAGTTQLFTAMTRHPRCFPSVGKELQYFSKRSDRPLSWYRSRFPLKRTVERVAGICMEATPAYLPSPRALRMMADVLPNAKVIALLRDPVARAFSHYQHNKTRHLETRTFTEVVQEALDERSHPPEFGAALGPDVPPLMHYIHRGYYALQLEVLFERYPREQVLVLDSADLFDDTNAACQGVFEFLGLERHDVPPKKIHNRGYYREKVDPATAASLREHYRPYDEMLAELLGCRLRWMDAAADRSAAA